MVAESPEIERKNVFQHWPVNLDGRTLSKLILCHLAKSQLVQCHLTKSQLVECHLTKSQ
jgi:hypothetical protein